MYTISGLILNLIGTIVTVYDLITSKPNINGMTLGELDNIGSDKAKSKKFAIRGLLIIAAGFLLQIVGEVL